MRVIGYTRVSKEEQGGLGLDAQRSRIESEAERRGWDVRWIEDAGVTGRHLRRAGIDEALRALAKGDAEALVVAKVDRLSRSLLDFTGLVARAKKERWALVALDLGLDMTTAQGRFFANMMATFAEFEREQIAERTSAALARLKAKGVRLGRAPLVSDAVVRRIVRLRRAGHSQRAIAERLNASGVSPPLGKQWHQRTVGKILARVTKEVA